MLPLGRGGHLKYLRVSKDRTCCFFKTKRNANTSWNMKHELMNGVLGHLCAHIGQTGPGESPENGEENQMIYTPSAVSSVHV